MIYIELVLAFLKIGLFSFGGAYGAIPLIQETAAANGWADAEMFANLVALSETIPGALCATIGVVFPSFVIILIVTAIFQNILKQKNVQAVLKGVKPCLMGVILATGTYMALSLCTEDGSLSADLPACIILFILAAAAGLHHRFRKKEFPPAALLLLAAACGCVFY